MEKKRTIFVFLGIFIFAVFFVLFFFISLFVLFSQREENENSSNGTEVFVNKYHQFNSRTNKASIGFVEIFDKLGEEFISYNDKDGNYFLISDIEIDDYQCSASCYCEDDSRRRTTGTIASKSMFYLVAAVSSVLALNKAKEYFHEECERQISDTCVQTSIKSDVKECKKIYINEDKMENDEEKIVEEEDIKGVDEWQCYGTCVPKSVRTKELEHLIQYYHCDRLSIDALIKVERKLYHNVYFPGKVEHVKRKFQTRVLEEFCVKESVIKEEFEFIWNEGEKVTKNFVNENACVGGNSDGLNPHIICVKVEEFLGQIPEYDSEAWID